MADDLRRVFGERFVALVASGPHAAVAFATDIRPGDLEALAPLADSWHRDQLEAPVLLTTHEFRRSLDAFPVEYQALIDRHDVIAGTPPFADVNIDPDSLRRACEVQAKSHLIHLRQGWVESAGGQERLAELLVRSSAPLGALLADLSRLDAGTEEVGALAGVRVAGIDPELARAILDLDADPTEASRLVARMPEYVAMAERLWAFVDTWTP